MKKILLVAIFLVSIFVLASVSKGVTGLFYKVSTKNLYPGDSVEQNFTVKKFYNLTAKFQKYNSTSDLTIRNVNMTLIFKDGNLTEVFRIIGISGNSVSSVVDKLILDKIQYVSAYNINNSANTYEDVENQLINVSYSGLKAAIIVKTNQIVVGDAIVYGYIVDALTNQTLDNVVIFANYENNTVAENSTINGTYTIVLRTNSLGKTFDFYTKDYEISTLQ